MKTNQHIQNNISFFIPGVEGGLGEGVEGGFRRGPKTNCGQDGHQEDRNVPGDSRKCNSNQNCEFWQMSRSTMGWYCCAKGKQYCQ